VVRREGPSAVAAAGGAVSSVAALLLAAAAAAVAGVISASVLLLPLPPGAVLMPVWRATCSRICKAAAKNELILLLLASPAACVLPAAAAVAAVAAAGPAAVAAPAEDDAVWRWEGLLCEAVREEALRLWTLEYLATGRASITACGVRLLRVAPAGLKVIPSSAACRIRRAMRHIL